MSTKNGSESSNERKEKKMKGTVKWFNGAKGYGFINGEDGKDYFVHFSGINGTGFKVLNDGANVTFDTMQTDKGQQAVNVSEV